MKSKPTLSAVIVAKNEEQLLPGCLASLKFCDEIVVVVDESTTDRTAEIAKAAGARVYTRRLDNFAAQRNYSLEQVKSDWVLSIDADERVRRALREEIGRVTELGKSWGYEIPYRPYAFGLEIKHSGWVPSYQLRLFRAEGRFSGEVHEGVVPKGKVGKLINPMIHYNYNDVSQYIGKLNLYTSFEAGQMHKAGVRFKTSMLMVKPAREFAYRYLKQRGWKDGFIGFVIAGLMTFYRFAVVLKLWELGRQTDVARLYKDLDAKL